SRLLASNRFNLLFSDDGGLSWEEPSNAAGFIGNGLRSLAFDPSDPRIRFASGIEGTFRSADGGASWEILRDGLRIEVARSTALDPANPLGLYLGTDRGEMRSIDGGASWISIAGLRFPQPVRKILLHPQNPRLILSAHQSTIRQSRNSGQSWQTSFSRSGLVRTIVRDRSNPELIYAGTGNQIGFFSSGDGGQNWQSALFGLASSINAIAIDPTDSLTLYAGGAQGLFKSQDGGAGWAPAMQGISDAHIHSLAVDPANPQVAYAGTSSQGIFKTTDSGASWNALGGPSTAIIRSLLIDPLDSGRLWAGTWGEGIFLSEDAGESWDTFNQGLENPFVWELSLSDVAVSRLFAATLGGLAACPLDESAPAFLSVQMEVSGNPFPGGMLIYTITLSNQGQPGRAAPPARLVASFSPLLELVEVRADTGSPLLGPGDHTVSWEGTVEAGGQVIVQVRAILRDTQAGTTISSLARLSADTDGDGIFESAILSGTPSNPLPGSPAAIQSIESTLESDLLAVPYALNIDSTFVGLAMANLSGSENGLEFLALDDQGQLLEERRDDALLPAHGQVPFVTTEVFDEPSATLAIRGTENALQGFFMMGDSASNRLDGLGGPLADSQLHYITQVRHTAQVSTHLYLFNSDPLESADAVLQLFDLQGALVAEAAVSLSPFGSTLARAEELFGPAEFEDGFIRLEATRPVRGFALLADSERFAALAARPPLASEDLWAPHSFWNDQGGTTRLR
ncbi:MAG: YCF48-related protein, partial [Acidobacteriota bacterium]